MSKSLPEIEFRTERPKLLAGREQTVDFLIRITPPDLDEERNGRPKLNLSLVLDRSGSMSGAKIERAREAAIFCVDQLLSTDRLSVVVFDEVIETLFQSQLVMNREMMKDLLGRVGARGSTALHEAWVSGGMAVSEHLADGGINRVVLITDGQANVGLTNTDDIVTQSCGLFQRGVSTSTIGIGDDFNEDLLLPMAQSAGGNAWHVQEPQDLQRIFQVELQGLVAQFAHTATLGLIPADGARIVDLFNDFELTETGRYRLPNLQAGSPLEVVVRLRVPAQERGAQMRLVDLKLEFTHQEANAAEVVKQSHSVEFVTETELEEMPVDYEVVKALRLLMNARARREAIQCMDADDLAGATRSLSQAIDLTRVTCAPIGNAPEVLEECISLESVGAALKDPLLFKRSRKELAYKAYERQTGKRRE